MTQTEAFERKLASNSQDSTCSYGTFLVQTTVGTTPSAILSIQPSSFGVRAIALGAIYARYRFKYLRIKFTSSASGSSAAITSALAIFDDSSSGEGDLPTTIGGVLECRCSATFLQNSSIPTQFMWEPVDKSKWYYTYGGASGSDPRLTVQAILAAAAIANSSGLVAEVDYCIVYKGAVDIGTS
jgi:hypothetical protein